MPVERVRCLLLIARMRELKLSVGRCAEETGIAERTLVRYRQGEALNPEVNSVRCLAQRLGLDPDELLEAIISAAVANLNSGLLTQNGATLAVEDDVNRDGYVRRQLLISAAATAAAAGNGFTAVLLSPALSTSADEPQMAVLVRALARAKEAYQECRHAAAAELLRKVVPRVEVGESLASGMDRLLWAKIVAETYQLSTSILLRFGHRSLALMTADRSLRAAERSQVLTAIAASARVMTHALMRSDEAAAAAVFAADKAAELERKSDCEADGPDIWSVRGALLLRGAQAAAESGKISQSTSMVAEASELAARVGEGANYKGTAFTPSNVLAHQMSIELALGNAGRAIDFAKKIELPRMGTVERQAGVQLDVARAFTQWGKFDQALGALWEIERIAPQELRLRSSARDIIRQMGLQAPRSIKTEASSLAERIGLAVT